MGKIIGIDLGTTNSVVAIMEGKDPKVITNEEGGRLTPSVVAFDDKGEVLVGQIARRQAITNPENTVFSVKRFMGRRGDEVSEEVKKVPYKVAKAAFGIVPPDLSLVGRSKGADWLYTYMRSFYRDPGSKSGWNNLVFPNVAMPHVLWESQGEQHLEVTERMDQRTGDVKREATYQATNVPVTRTNPDAGVQSIVDYWVAQSAVAGNRHVGEATADITNAASAQRP